MIHAEFRDVEIQTQGQSLRVRAALKNISRQIWKPENFVVGWQFFDPETNLFISEGEWVPLVSETAPGAEASFNLSISFPPEPGKYQVYFSAIAQPDGWTYARGEPFLRVLAEVVDNTVHMVDHEITTLRRLRWRRLWAAAPRLLSAPFRTIANNRGLIRSMARRDILARYRGSFGDVFWTILNPLLLMATYFFVFGVVLRTRFGADRSSTGFALYFLAGMLPWLAFAEPLGRSPHVILEHRNFVKKLVFPLDTLPVNQVVAGLVTELFAAVVFIAALLIIRRTVPLSIVWLPLLLVPQLFFTLGACWFLSALGVFMRDLGQIMGFLLTLWFFLTPICYPESSLPPSALALLGKNPIFVLVRGYRAIFLEAHAPQPAPLLKLWVLSIAVFLLGHAWFSKLRKGFADVI